MANTDGLTATFRKVRLMTDQAARVRFDELRHQPALFRQEADELQFLGDRLGKPVKFRHLDLAGDGWRPGRWQGD